MFKFEQTLTFRVQKDWNDPNPKSWNIISHHDIPIINNFYHHILKRFILIHLNYIFTGVKFLRIKFSPLEHFQSYNKYFWPWSDLWTVKSNTFVDFRKRAFVNTTVIFFEKDPLICSSQLRKDRLSYLKDLLILSYFLYNYTLWYCFSFPPHVSSVDPPVTTGTVSRPIPVFI